MHPTTESFERASETMKRLVTEACQFAYQIGDPGSRLGTAFFAAVEYECDKVEETVLVEVRYNIGKVMGRGRTHYTYSPVFSTHEGFPQFRDRLTTMLEQSGHPVSRLDVVHITDSDCWGLLLGFAV